MFKLNKKSQTVLEILLIVILFVVVVIFLDYNRANRLNAEIASHYESAVLKKEMLVLMNKEEGDTIAEKLSIFLCYGHPELKKEIGDSINNTLRLMNHPKNNYIFFVSYFNGTANNTIHIWDKQESVCAGQLSLANYDIELVCNDEMNIKSYLAIFPQWKDIPTKEACEGV